MAIFIVEVEKKLCYDSFCIVYEGKQVEILYEPVAVRYAAWYE